MATRIDILGVSIEGYRGIQDPLELSFSHPKGGAMSRVVLSGPNGSGKTTVLEAILVALGREQRGWGVPAGSAEHLGMGLPSGARVQLRCLRGAHRNAHDAESEVWITRTSDRWELRWRGRIETNPVMVQEWLDRIPVQYFSSWRSPASPESWQTPIGRHPPKEGRLSRLKQRIIDERARRAFVRDPTETQDAQRLRRLNEVWSSFHCDGSTIDADVVDPAVADPMFDVFVFDGPTRRCSIDQLGSGELELLSLADTLLLDGFDGLLLIDEPELHLHREWRTGLMNVLTTMAPHAQIIMATHADELWDQAYSFERFFFAVREDPRGARSLPVAGRQPLKLPGAL